MGKEQPINQFRANVVLLTLSIIGCAVVTFVLAGGDWFINKNFNSPLPSQVAGVQTSPSPTTATLTPSPTPTKAPVYKVVSVTDGDTITIQLNGAKQKVRLLGVDTPESVKPGTPVQCFAIAASDETKSLLDGEDVYIQTDPTQGTYDKYNRMLLYIWRVNDDLFINDYLVRQGYGHEYTYNKAYQYQSQFRADEAQAKAEQDGLWGSPCYGKP